MTDTVRAIVVTFNTKDIALDLLADLRRELAALPGSQIVVVDNASADGTPDAVEAAFPDIQVRRSPANVGFGAAVNLAAADASSAAFRWLLLVNPDARIDDGAVATLVAAATRDPGHGLYGGRFIDVARGTNEDSVAMLPTLGNLLAFATGVAPVLRRLGYRSPPRRKANSDREIPVDALPGTFLLVEVDAWRAVGGFDEKYFMYSEDLDLCVRISATGRRPLYVPQARIRHIGGASSTSGAKEVLKNRSLVTFLRTHWSPDRARAGRVLLVAGVGLRRLARLPFRTPAGRWETAWRERRSWTSGW
ncbi:MAG TPA: glycosyltransferase [Acidothermaceae bacterium]